MGTGLCKYNVGIHCSPFQCWVRKLLISHLAFDLITEDKKRISEVGDGGMMHKLEAVIEALLYDLIRVGSIALDEHFS